MTSGAIALVPFRLSSLAQLKLAQGAEHFYCTGVGTFIDAS